MNSTLLFGASDSMESAAVSSTFLAGFIASSLMIFSSELADKSFFIAVIMAANYNSLIVFLGSAGALTTMSVISVVIGRVLMKFIWPEITSLVCACLFTVFGVLSIKEACDESSKPKEEGEESEENEGMAEAREALVRRNTITSVADAEADTITDVPGPDSPKSNWALFCQIFGLVFLSEWGDKTQIATISLGTTHNPAGVAVGASFGISLCSAIAVIGGTVLSKRIKPQQMAILGAAVFLFFGIMGFYDMYDQNQFDCLLKRFDGEECLVQEIGEEMVGGAHNVTGDI